MPIYASGFAAIEAEFGLQLAEDTPSLPGEYSDAELKALIETAYIAAGKFGYILMRAMASENLDYTHRNVRDICQVQRSSAGHPAADTERIPVSLVPYWYYHSVVVL